jgi:hypothetical protein
MKESYTKANDGRIVTPSHASANREGGGEALTGGIAGLGSTLRNHQCLDAHLNGTKGRQNRWVRCTVSVHRIQRRRGARHATTSYERESGYLGVHPAHQQRRRGR